MTLATFTFIRNFADETKSRFFLTDSSGFREVSAVDVASHEGLLICHDFWMIAHSIYTSCEALPKKVVDLDEFNILVSPNPKTRRRREKFDAIDRMAHFLLDGEQTLLAYKKTLYQEAEVEIAVHEAFHKLLTVYYIELCRRALLHGEFNRFFVVELPCTTVCSDISSRGIAIDGSKISEYRAAIRHDYYESLKELSDNFNVPLEVPTDRDVERYLRFLGVDLDEYGLGFAFSYLPTVKGYADAVQKVRDLSMAREVLNSIALKEGRVFPTVDTQGSRTSRISVRSPFLQNLSKRYRDIIQADPNKTLSYVDFDQFEVGIMAALSGDPELHALFAEEDMYESFRMKKLRGQGSRKAAKILFLAYAYGMKRRNLPIVGHKFGFDRAVVRDAFKSFSIFERWKQGRLKEFDNIGYVSTSFGNRFYSANPHPTKKERLSAISQIVQGEGSLIFKKALLKVSALPDAEILLPMHDAVLFQHKDPKTSIEVVSIFAETMTFHFDSAVTGKASVERFFD